jgi:hypothetical protein
MRFMYPGDALLVEVGRVAIAGARLEIWMGFLWWHLNPAVDQVTARRTSFKAQRKVVLTLALERLQEGLLRMAVLDTVEEARLALDQRHEVIHQDWLLNTQEHVLAEGDLARFFGRDLANNMDHVERYAHDSENWSRIPARGLQADEAPTRLDLVKIERRLSAATRRLTYVTRDVASARELGLPVGYLRGPVLGSQ